MCKYIESIIIFWIPFFTMQKLSETIMLKLLCFPFFKFIYLLLVFFLSIWVLCFISGIPGSFRSIFFPSENDSFANGCNHRCMTHYTSMVYMGPPWTFNFQALSCFSQKQYSYYLFIGYEKSVFFLLQIWPQQNSRWNCLFFASQVKYYYFL